MEDFLDSSGSYLNPNFSLGNLTSLDGYYVVTDDEDVIPTQGPAADKIVVPVFFSILAVSGITANSGALTLLYKQKTKLSVTDIYMLSHFVSNILYLSVLAPLIAIAYGLTDWIFGDFGCKSVNYGMTLCLAASTLSVTVACLHHCLGHGRGQNDKTLIRNRHIAKVITAAMWIVAGITMIPRVFLYSIDKRWHIIDERRFCTRNQGAAIFRKVDTCVTFLSLFFVPLLVQAACHIRIFRDLKRLATDGQTIFSRLTVAKLLAGISVAVFIGWLPTQVINFSEDFTADIDGGSILFKHREVLAYGFSYATMTATPLVYYLCQRRLRQRNSYTVSRKDQTLIMKKSPHPAKGLESGDALISDYIIQSRQKITAL